MNTNQYWDPLKLATSIKKTPSYESLPEEGKLKRRLDKMEDAIKQCDNIVKIHNNNTEKYDNRMHNIIDSSEEDIRDFYIDSPSFSNQHMIESLIWLSLSDKEKKKILDDDIDTYFR
tara:strand:- start:232 stop:582 length:351 start_codon:yes stop_codon:yes gene_type:complete